MAKTLSQLRQEVSNLVAGGTTLTSNTNPSTDQVDAWLNEAQLDIVRVMPYHTLRGLLEIYNPSIAAVSEINLASFSPTYFKFGAMTITPSGIGSRIPVQLVTPEYANYRDVSSFIGSTNSPICWIDSDKLKFLPATTGTAAADKTIITYIKQPTDLATASDTTEFEDEFELPLILYACAKFMQSEEELNQYANYQAEYMKALSDILKSWRVRYGA